MHCPIIFMYLNHSHHLAFLHLQDRPSWAASVSTDECRGGEEEPVAELIA